MRFTTHTLLIAATVASSLAAGQPALAQSSVPLTADEKREKSRLTKAKGVSHRREAALRRFAYAEKCEVAFAADDPMPEIDFFFDEQIEIGDDLLAMSMDEILEESAKASDALRASEKAWKACVLEYQKRNDGS